MSHNDHVPCIWTIIDQLHECFPCPLLYLMSIFSARITHAHIFLHAQRYFVKLVLQASRLLIVGVDALPLQVAVANFTETLEREARSQRVKGVHRVSGFGCPREMAGGDDAYGKGRQLLGGIAGLTSALIIQRDVEPAALYETAFVPVGHAVAEQIDTSTGTGEVREAGGEALGSLGDDAHGVHAFGYGAA
eukprot:CAMPEP_0185728322 /NCGR_PEP_ID=MMETSP1171-20130828/3704_1 /TAXON_ID=374046 /ORGANISM="Helicotheca tamensis, Strain CCMP826" /LENGTH=190 /DNA_ID=CAMNT_0028397015 /DNA_START=150 /DNA_END=722 /DNA_ORIENTATION=+